MEIKEEPVWLEGTASTSFDSYQLVSEETHLKEETQLEFAEPGQTQVNTFELFADIKDEVFVEEHKVGQLVPCLKEENVENVGVFTKDPVHSCDLSSEVLKTGGELTCHVRTYSKQSYRDCVSNQKVLSHSGERSVHCKRNNSTFSLEDNLGDRISPSGERPYRCNESATEISRKCDHRKDVLIDCVQRPHVCNECGKTFSLPAYSVRAYRGCVSNAQVLSYSGQRSVSPKENNSTFSEKANPEEKTSPSEERLHCCNECITQLSRKTDKHRDLLTNYEQRPHFCNECGKTFSRKCDLNTHMRIHVRVRPYNCTGCGRGYTCRSRLLSHMRYHSGERPHRCNQCNKTFFQKWSLMSHMRTHSAEKPFQCNECGRAFSHKCDLAYHLATTSGDGQFVCNQCGRKFSYKCTLKLHILSHTG